MDEDIITTSQGTIILPENVEEYFQTKENEKSKKVETIKQKQKNEVKTNISAIKKKRRTSKTFKKNKKQN